MKQYVFQKLFIIVLLILVSHTLLFGDNMNNTQERILRTLNKVYERTRGKAKAYIYEELVVSHDHIFPIILSEEEWKKRLSDWQYYILREEGTERARTGKYDKFYEKGTYYSAATGQPLFSSQDKYDSKTGWPSFSKPIIPDTVRYRIDNKLFSTRIEVVDSLSGSHLGHVFEDGPFSTGLRYCMNSAALIFVPEGESAPNILSSSLE